MQRLTIWMLTQRISMLTLAKEIPNAFFKLSTLLLYNNALETSHNILATGWQILRSLWKLLRSTLAVTQNSLLYA